MTAISKTTLRLNEFKDAVSANAKQSISKLDIKIKGSIKSVVEFFNSANKPISSTSLNSKNIVLKEGKEVDCAVECCQCCAESTRGCCWASG